MTENRANERSSEAWQNRLGFWSGVDGRTSPVRAHFGVERLVGFIRRDCLDHAIVLGEGHLRRILKSYLEYHHSSRTHLALAKDSPESRAVQPPELGATHSGQLGPGE